MDPATAASTPSAPSEPATTHAPSLAPDPATAPTTTTTDQQPTHTPTPGTCDNDLVEPKHAPTPSAPQPIAAAVAAALPWYTPVLESVPAPFRALLETYSGIPPADVIPHVREVRDLAWRVFPYPCIGRFRFTSLDLSQHAAYPRILGALKSQPARVFLDLGCGLGQELHKLAADGAPPSSLYGSDLRPEYIRLGERLFRAADHTTTTAAAGAVAVAAAAPTPRSPTFYVGDFFAGASVADCSCAALAGRVDVVWVGCFLHLFGWAQQLEACVRIAGLLRADAGGLVVGRMMGNVQAGEYPRRRAEDGTVFRHDATSLAALWAEVGRRTASKWRVEAVLEEPDAGDDAGRARERVWPVKGTRRLEFEVERVE